MRLICLFAAVGGYNCNPFDPAQVPVVTVRASSPPEIAWAPAGAQIVRVFRGTSAGTPATRPTRP